MGHKKKDSVDLDYEYDPILDSDDYVPFKDQETQEEEKSPEKFMEKLLAADLRSDTALIKEAASNKQLLLKAYQKGPELLKKKIDKALISSKNNALKEVIGTRSSGKTGAKVTNTRLSFDAIAMKRLGLPLKRAKASVLMRALLSDNAKENTALRKVAVSRKSELLAVYKSSRTLGHIKQKIKKALSDKSSLLSQVIDTHRSEKEGCKATKTRLAFDAIHCQEVYGLPPKKMSAKQLMGVLLDPDASQNTALKKEAVSRKSELLAVYKSNDSSGGFKAQIGEALTDKDSLLSQVIDTRRSGKRPNGLKLTNTRKAFEKEKIKQAGAENRHANEADKDNTSSRDMGL